MMLKRNVRMDFVKVNPGERNGRWPDASSGGGAGLQAVLARDQWL